MNNFNFSKEPGKSKIENRRDCTTKAMVSIITPYYNAGEFFEKTFNSVMNQTFSNFEWIIVNDGSTRNQDVAILNRLAESDNRIVVYNQNNKGQASARNHAIRKCTTDIIIPLDADDLIEPYYIECLYNGLLRYGNAGWCYMDSVGFYKKNYIWCQKFSAGRNDI